MINKVQLLSISIIGVLLSVFLVQSYLNQNLQQETAAIDNNYAIAIRGQETSSSLTLAATDLISHDPIVINGDSEFTAANGVISGSGTKEDPYIIANWSINASSTDGIAISFTNVYFVIRDVYIEGDRVIPTLALFSSTNMDSMDMSSMDQTKLDKEEATAMMFMMQYHEESSMMDEMDAKAVFNSVKNGFKLLQIAKPNGIKLTNVTNGVIDSVTITKTDRHGIFGFNVSNLNITNSNITVNGHDSIRLAHATHAFLANNLVSDALDGIGVEGKSSDIHIENNVSTNHLYCGYVLIPSRGGGGPGPIVLLNPSNVTLLNNSASGNKWGLQLMSRANLSGPVNVTIAGNVLSDNSFHGIFLNNSSTAVITNNTSSNNGRYGIFMQNITNNYIAQNLIANNLRGIGLQTARLNTLENNSITGNTQSLTFTLGSESNIVYSNIFNATGSQVIDIQSSNFNNITDNISTSGTLGITLKKSNYTLISGNSISNVTTLGITVQQNSNFNTITANTVLGSGKFDLHWDGSGTGNIWSGNTFGTKSPNIVQT